MASGANGQQFRFNGYLPAQDAPRIDAIRKLEADSRKSRQAELFIETPYRNLALFSALLTSCRPDTQLTLACDLTLASEFVRSQSIADWKKSPAPEIGKRPTVFVLFAS
jgi:16S rRNA (cytidine1402-2'-O)-methyltransferase